MKATNQMTEPASPFGPSLRGQRLALAARWPTPIEGASFSSHAHSFNVQKLEVRFGFIIFVEVNKEYSCNGGGGGGCVVGFTQVSTEL